MTKPKTVAVPGLYGLNKDNSNKDFSNRESWGKNQFNNAFPVALACYMHSKQIRPVYLTLDQKLRVSKGQISVEDALGTNPASPDVFFSFESDFTPYRTMVVGSLPRTDLVIQDKTSRQAPCLKAYEIKLTALPDNTTVDSSESDYGSEIVVRPDTIVYLALSMARIFNNRRDDLRRHFDHVLSRTVEWSDTDEVRPLVPQMSRTLDAMLQEHTVSQSPFMLQPVWKTEGKKLHLHENCLDLFVWSDFAFTRLFVDNAIGQGTQIGRRMRTIVWLSKMLYGFSVEGRIGYRQIIDTCTYDTRNDKAFAVSGIVTNPYMKCEQLTKPRIRKNEVANIILGGGEKLLSPERRLDAAILTTPGLFGQ